MTLPLMGSHLKNIELLRQITTKLKSLREEKGLTQEDVYNDTGIHISRIERSKVNITVSTLSALCDYFDIKLSDFLKGI
ncbi:helix-turn-helix domain-containing protein [Aquimarina algiphila]|uniref:helix-turn-helix domain-containing protein n=1 Tax=Aquimarina algiphila TaxID=2047982 RepID=UPI00248FB35D|nr:helix-turn-helix transcriptional regulator [Aquimarina algiphila]